MYLRKTVVFAKTYRVPLFSMAAVQFENALFSKTSAPSSSRSSNDGIGSGIDTIIAEKRSGVYPSVFDDHVYNIRSRPNFRRAPTHDDDAGLRREGDFKKKQVRHVLAQNLTFKLIL